MGCNALVSQISNCSSLPRTAPNCHCDLGVGAFWRTGERLGIHFLPAYSDDAIRMVAKEGDVLRTAGGAFFLAAFSPSMWSAVGLLVIAFSALKGFNSMIARKKVCTERGMEGADVECGGSDTRKGGFKLHFQSTCRSNNISLPKQLFNFPSLFKYAVD